MHTFSGASCKVCGAKPTVLAYTVMACINCQNFFQRHRDSPKGLCRVGNNQCQITQESRICTWCRYKKCLDVGMVHPDVARQRAVDSYQRLKAASSTSSVVSGQALPPRFPYLPQPPQASAPVAAPSRPAYSPAVNLPPASRAEVNKAIQMTEEMQRSMHDHGRSARLQEKNLRQASLNGKAEEVKDLLCSGVNPNCEGPVDEKVKIRYEPLYLAVEGGLKDVVKLLIDAGADLNKRNRGENGDFCGHTPLILSIMKEDYDIFKMLIDAGSDLNTADAEYGGRSPLDWSIDSPLKFMKKLLEEGANTNRTNKYGSTVLHVICKRYDADSSYSMAFEMLLKAGANPNLRDKKGRTPLCLAAYLNNKDMAERLIDAGAQCHHKENSKCYRRIKRYRAQSDPRFVLGNLVPYIPLAQRIRQTQ